ncbi:GAF domain-containing protein [Thalassobacillus pellis]|uniref:GAF domain-containing protein n=1 Tax=Thalassobacillus pellis TaxID=748008 RepID=UPI00195F9DD5|nr:GAF domain-containing protein [Thalassobacillus pellis]MBM7554193.1 transcriptional regulator with GAF, ATPase, and Fis domain [Thalassobacillus pellis]
MAFNKDEANRQALILDDLTILEKALACDFVGVALQKQKGLEITWPFVRGNRNEKYKYISIRYGKGIAGKVIATGSPMEINLFPVNISGKSTDYPIMLAEQLNSAYALPLYWNGIPKGALLIASRTGHFFTEDEKRSADHIKRQIESHLPEYFNQGEEG